MCGCKVSVREGLSHPADVGAQGERFTLAALEPSEFVNLGSHAKPVGLLVNFFKGLVFHSIATGEVARLVGCAVSWEHLESCYAHAIPRTP